MIETKNNNSESFQNSYVFNQFNNSINSFVVNESTNDCSLKCLSLDQIGSLNFNASARYVISFGSDISDNIFLSSSLYSEISTNITFCLREEINDLKVLKSDFFNNSFLYLDNSINAKSGAINFNECLKRSSFATLDDFTSANKTLASTTNFILNPYYINFSFFNDLIIPSFTLEPILTDQSSNSLSCLSFLSISSFQANCLALFSIDFLIQPDQFISENLLINSFTSLGIDNVTDTILITHNYVKKHKYVNIYKCFGLKGDFIVEKMGTGIKRIKEECKKHGNIKFKIETNGYFISTFNLNKIINTSKDLNKDLNNLTQNQEKIILEIKRNTKITQKQLSEIVGINEKNVRNNIAKLKQKGVLQRMGSPKGGHWKIESYDNP